MRPTDPRRADVLGAGVRLTTGTNEFLARAADRTVGVTGTKGKSTTSTFVHALLRAEACRPSWPATSAPRCSTCSSPRPVPCATTTPGSSWS